MEIGVAVIAIDWVSVAGATVISEGAEINGPVRANKEPKNTAAARIAMRREIRNTNGKVSSFHNSLILASLLLVHNQGLAYPYFAYGFDSHPIICFDAAGLAFRIAMFSITPINILTGKAKQMWDGDCYQKQSCA